MKAFQSNRPSICYERTFKLVRSLAKDLLKPPRSSASLTLDSGLGGIAMIGTGRSSTQLGLDIVGRIAKSLENVD
jgi:hypothetical protein